MAMQQKEKGMHENLGILYYGGFVKAINWLIEWAAV